MFRMATLFGTMIATALAVTLVGSTSGAIIDLNGGGVHTEGFGVPVVTPNALNAFAYNVTGNNGDNRIDDIGIPGDADSILLASPISHIIIDGTDRIRYDNDNDFRNGDGGFPSQGFATSLDGLPGLNQNDNFATVFMGEIIIPDLNGGAAYDVEFGTNRADDPANIYVDLDQDGIFENDAGQGATAGNERVVDRGCCGNAYTTVSILPGTYNYLAAQVERGGGSGIEPTIDLTPDAHGRLVVQPGGSDRPGLFQFTVTPAAGIGNDFEVDGMGNVINIPATMGGVAYGTLTFDADTPDGANELSINAPGSGSKGVSFTSTTLGGTSNTINANDSNSVTLGGVSGSGGLIVSGNGTVNLNAGGSYTGQTTINNGATVHVTNNTGLGATGAGNGTVVNSGGALRLSNGITIGDDVTINGSGNSSTDAAIYTPSGTNNIDGAVSTTGNSRIRVAAGSSARLRLRGGLAMDHNLTAILNGSGERLEINAPITGSGNLTLEGDGVTELRANSPGYSGAVNITNGVADVYGHNQGLGTGTINVDGDATLRFRDGVDLVNNVTLNGTANSGNGQDQGRLHNENNTNSLQGTLAVNANSRFDVNNNSTLTLAGVVSGSGNIEKTDSGLLVFSNAGNSFTGALNVKGGTVQASSVAALGNTPDIAVAGGGTLDILGTATLNVPVSVSNGAIANSAAGTTLTLNGPLNLPLISDITFAGDGDTIVVQPLGNGNSPVSPANSLAHFGYHINNDGVAMDLNNNAGMMGGGDPLAGPSFYGLSFLTSGPGNRGLDFNDDGDFTATGSIGQNDNYSNLWVGKFTAPQTGDYGFRNAGDDDRAGIWFDLNQNGTFESTTAGLGSNRGEQLSWEDGGWKTVSLVAGQEYLVGFTHREGGGGSRADFRFRGPGISGEPIIKPADAAQAGIWESTAIQPDNNLTKTGAGTVTLQAAATYSGNTMVSEGTLVATAGITVNESKQLSLGGGAAFTATTGAFELGGATTAAKAGTLTLGGAGTTMTVTTPNRADFSGTAAPTLADGLLGMWTFDDETPNDSSGNNNHGTASGGGNPYGAIAYTTDTGNGSSNALDLSDGADNAVWVDTGGNQDTFDGGNAMTLAAWVKGTPGGWGPFISKGESGWQMRRHGGNNSVDWTTRGLDSSDWEVPNSGPAIDGEWHFLVMTYDGSKKMTYLYGADLASPVIESINTTGTITARSDIMVFGARDRDNNPASLDGFFDGYLDDIFFYDRALNDAEVAAMYNNGAALPVSLGRSTAVVDDLAGAGTIDATDTGGLEVTTSLDIGDGIGQIDVLGDLILGEDIGIEWEFSGDTDRDLVTITGDLELPSAATVNVTDLLGTSDLASAEILFTAGSFSGAGDLSGWLVTGIDNGSVLIDGANVVLQTSVPEPSTIVLMILGGLGLLAVARRRRRTA